MKISVLFLIIVMNGAFFRNSWAADMQFMEFNNVLEGANVVRVKDLNGRQALLAFWRSDCVPCRNEIPILLTIADDHPALHVVLVALQNSAPIRSYLPQHLPDNLQLWNAENETITLLTSFGEPIPALPFSVLLRSDGSVCQSHQGVVGTDRALKWIASC